MFVLPVLVLTTISSICAVLYYRWTRRRLYALAKQYSGPPSYPVIGNALSFLCKNEEILTRINTFLNSYEAPMKFWLGPDLCLCFTDPNHVEKILSSSKFAYKHKIYTFVKTFLGEGLVTASGPRYKIHRRMIQPLINIKFTESFYDVFTTNTNLCLDTLQNYVGKGNFDIHHILHKSFVDIIGEAILGQSLHIQKNGYTSFVQAAIEMYNFGFTRVSKPWLHPNIIYNNTKRKVRENKLLEAINEFLDKIVKDSWQRVKSKHHQKTESVPIIDQIAEIIEENPEIMTNEEFASHMLTLYAASEDTLTIESSFLCMCLGMYPEYQKKAAQEIREIFGETPRPVTLSDIAKLKYLDMCIKDVLRLAPIAPLILRDVKEECELDTYIIPKGCAIVVPIFNVHRDPKHWENPLHFHPDHFLPEIERKRHVYAYVPFSAGPRGCIGKVFAKLGLKLFIASFLQRYEVEADGKFPDVKLKMDISTRPIEGYNVRIKPRVWT